MNFQYELKNKKLKIMVEKRAKELNMNVNQLIWGYINRGLMGDNLNEENFERLHSEKFLKNVDDTLNVD